MVARATCRLAQTLLSWVREPAQAGSRLPALRTEAPEDDPGRRVEVAIIEVRGVALTSLFHAGPGHVRSGVPAWLEFREAV